ncbi:ABC transporter substrate-binding protein [Citricoccus sp. GCM10030269]
MSLIVSGCGSSIGGDEGSAGEDQGPLKVGLIVPATGQISDSGLAMQAGFEVGIDKINNDGGVGGQPVEYEVQDNQSDPATTAQIARQYARADDTSLMFGTITGDSAVAAGKVADQEKIPFSTVILGDPAVCSPYAWAFGPSNRQLLSPLVPELIEEYGSDVAIVGSDYIHPRQYAARAKEIVEASGGTVVAEEYSPMGTTDFASTIGRLQDAEPDVLLSMVVGADAITFTHQADEFGLLTPELGFEGAPLDADYYGALSSLVDGREHSVRWSDARNDPESQEFVEAYREKTGAEGPIPEVAGNAYFAIRFIAAAANDAEAHGREELNAAIESFNYDSPLGQGTHFDGPANLLQADMFTATIDDGSYTVTQEHGEVADTETSCQ